MTLNIIIDNRTAEIQIPDIVMDEGHDFFDKIEADMKQGWRMGPQYVETPDQEQCIQIVADRLLAALETGKKELSELLAGYIVHRDPSIKSIRVDLNGDPLNTEIFRSN